jgi:hypothetical protein
VARNHARRPSWTLPDRLQLGYARLFPVLPRHLLTRHDDTVRQSIADMDQTARTCLACGRVCDDADGTIACLTAHIATAADMYAEANDLIRTIQGTDD